MRIFIVEEVVFNLKKWFGLIKTNWNTHLMAEGFEVTVNLR